jgi:hypothetical protein
MKLALAILAAIFFVSSALAQEKSKAVTIPITLDHNRTIIDVYLPLPDGSTKRVRGWVDNGNPELEITEALANKLGLAFRGEVKTNPGDRRAADPPHALQIGGMTISLAGLDEAHAIVGRESITPGSSAEINIPSTVLRNYDVLFDYPNRQFTIGPPGSISFQGTAIKAQINPQNGVIQIPSKIDGQDYSIAFDAGSSTSLLSGELIEKWQKAHPAWPHLTGAIGSANMWGAEEETKSQLLRLPIVDFGGAVLKNIVVAPFPAKFMPWYQFILPSKLAAEKAGSRFPSLIPPGMRVVSLPVNEVVAVEGFVVPGTRIDVLLTGNEERSGSPTIGLIGANAFIDSRVGVDYAHHALYIQRAQTKPAPDMDVVGLTLRPEPDEKYKVIGVVDYHGKPSVLDVKAGDVLVGVDGAPATGATMGQVWSLLGGTPGQTRTLTLERDGKRFSVDATVRRFLALESSTQPGKNHLPRAQK